MGVYIAPEIKDRVAVGDDLYTITDSGGKKKLTPSPTEVSEPGTEINKALLQPMADALARVDAAAVPYVLYWWRIRQSGGSYILKEVPCSQIVEAYSKQNMNDEYVSYVDLFTEGYDVVNGENEYFYGSLTIQVASSISMDSSGVISLVNPTSYTVPTDEFYGYMDTFANIIKGKYVKGLHNGEYIYKVDADFDRYDIDEYSYYYDSTDHYRNMYYIRVAKLQVPVSNYASVTSDFSYVSNEDENFYPHSGTQDGVEYQYLGKIFDVAVKAEPYGIKKVNITSASWTDGSYTIAMPHSRYMLWCYRDDTYSPSGVVLMVDNGLAYGEYLKITSSSENLRYVVGNSRITNVGGVTFAFTSTGITLTGSGTLTLAYLPL